jgi:death-on-curing protein
MIRWISRELVVMVHDRQLAEHGGGGGIRDENLLWHDHSS